MSIQEPSLWQRFSSYFSPAEQIHVPLATEKVVANCRANQAARRIVLVACGSFNPPTIMHLRMFDLARDHFREDGAEVIAGYLSPVNDAYGKEGLASASKRIQMARECTRGTSFLEVDDWESLQPSAQRSLNVLQRISDGVHTALLEAGLNPAVETQLLCGSDLLESMLKPGVWVPEHLATILGQFGVVSISRNPQDVLARVASDQTIGQFKDKITVVEDPFENNLSSSLVRRLIAKGKSTRYLVPDGALMLIEANKMYQAEEKDGSKRSAT